MKAGTLTSRIALALMCLLAAAGAQADNLLGVWRAAQARDPAYLSARQTFQLCLLYTSPSPRDGLLSRMPSSA